MLSVCSCGWWYWILLLHWGHTHSVRLTHIHRLTAKKLSMTLLVLSEVGQSRSLALWQAYWACSALLKARWQIRTLFYYYHHIYPSLWACHTQTQRMPCWVDMWHCGEKTRMWERKETRWWANLSSPANPERWYEARWPNHHKIWLECIQNSCIQGSRMQLFCLHLWPKICVAKAFHWLKLCAWNLT